MMEVDMQSPSFRTPRTSPSKMKRARSPPSPSTSTLESRPTKRLSLGGDDRTTISRLHAPCPPIRGRQTSEDWVVQTRSLRIGRDSNSPVADPKSFPPPIPEHTAIRAFHQEHAGDAGVVDMDEDMAMEFDETTHDSYAPLTCPPNSPVKMSTSPTLHYHMASQSHLPSIRYEHEHIPEHHDYPSASQSSQHSEHMQVSQTFSPSPDYPLTPSKKQKFTMGPRNDCDKCRRGVKGHWMHL